MAQDLQPPVIVVPGIQGTSLSDYYNIPPDEIWRLRLQNSFWNISPIEEHDRLALHPDSRVFEAREPAAIRSVSPHAAAYGEMVSELRHELAVTGSHPVFPFPYDWRQDIENIADTLYAFAKEVKNRVALIPGDYKGYDGPVDVVCHSMGGLITAIAVNKYGAEKLFRKVVSICAPFNGAVEAVWKLTTGQSSLMPGPAREREAARSLPSVYQLLPDYADAVDAADEGLKNLFDPNSWQPSVEDTLQTFIDKYSANINPRNLLSTFLQRASNTRAMANSAQVLTNLTGNSGGWMAIVGLGESTFVSMGSKRDNKGNVRFEYKPKVNQWPDGPNPNNTGDGSVPFLGAVPGFLSKNNLVCVSMGDFGMDVIDWGLAKVAGFHAMAPAMNFVQRLTIKYLTTKPSFYLDRTGSAAPGVTSWAPPITPTR
ncbi:MAG: alpha/beta fold hydrolase [Nitrospinae bacterium]|nr:alpha/beta fold hydrolase [Nitrospinota bacterium]